MSRLVLMRGLNKKAAGEDGPSFEEQLGTFANATIVDKFPQLDEERLAFQLIEKSEDNKEGIGAMVYQLGKSVVYIPAFFKDGQVDTGKIMFIANTQQFVPLSDPWIQYVREKDLQEPGELLEGTAKEKPGVSMANSRTFEWADPLAKSASLVTLKAISRTKPRKDGNGIFGMALEMGKEASSNMLDMLLDPGIMNNVLEFYSAEDIEEFAKTATALYEEVPKAPDYETVLPFTDEAKGLDATQSMQLARDGFFIKTAKDTAPNVVFKEELDNMFIIPSAPCKCKLLVMDGSTVDATLFKQGDDFVWHTTSDAVNLGPYPQGHRSLDPAMTAGMYMADQDKDLFAYIDGSVAEIPYNVMALGTSISKPVKLDEIGVPLESYKGKQFGGCDYGRSWFIMPDLTCVYTHSERFTPNKDNSGWGCSSRNSIILGDNPAQVSPIYFMNTVVLPKGTRLVYKEVTKQEAEDSSINEMNAEKIPALVTIGTLPIFLEKFTDKHYNKVSIYSNGNDYSMSTKTASSLEGSSGEVMQGLIKEYSVTQDVARIMVKRASDGATPGNPKRRQFLIEKVAYEDPEWKDSTIPFEVKPDKGPETEHIEMPNILEDPEKLKAAVTDAARKGIKEVFDVTVLKLLVKGTRMVDDISKELPTFMKTLDALCKELFRLSWHTEKFEKMYGVTKLPQLKDSIENALESLSELTVFFKMRNKGHDDSDFAALTGAMS